MSESSKNQITIQCLLIASEADLRLVWQLMIHTTELINSLLLHINNHPDLQSWLSRGCLPASIVDSFFQSARTQSPYREMPHRFANSAPNLVKEMFKSWFEVQQRKRLSLNGKKRFFAILKPDGELQSESGCSFEELCQEAANIRQKIEKKLQKKNKPPSSDKKEAFGEFTNILFKEYDNTDNPLTRSSISLLLKNQNRVPEQPEDPEKFEQRRATKKEEIERIEKQLLAKLPKGRRVDKQEWLEVLERAKEPITEVKDFIDIQSQLLRKFSELVYPVTFGSNTDLKWLLNDEGRICVRFKGIKNCTFEIACNKRQLHWFKRFLADHQLYKKEKKQVPTGLMPLRCARLVWIEGKDTLVPLVVTWLLIPLIQGKQLCRIALLLLGDRTTVKSPPWQVHHLHLHCTVDHRLWTQEGKDLVKNEKIAETKKAIAGSKEKEKTQENGLDKGQKQRLKKNETSLNLLEQSDLFKAADKPSYRGQPNRVLGVSMGPFESVSVLVIDTTTGKSLAFRNTKQLLDKKRHVRDKQPDHLTKFNPEYENGKDFRSKNFRGVYKEISDYELLLSYNRQKQRNKHQRHKAQVRGFSDNSGEANLGLYINRLLAKAIVQLAIEYHVSTIVLPELVNQREAIESQVIARAKLKIPKHKRLQQQYAKNILSKVSQWSYRQLSDCITNKASQSGILIDTVKSVVQGTPYEKAKNLICDFTKKIEEKGASDGKIIYNGENSTGDQA